VEIAFSMQMTSSLMSTQQLLETPRDVVYRLPVRPPNSSFAPSTSANETDRNIRGPCPRRGSFYTGGSNPPQTEFSMALGGDSKSVLRCRSSKLLEYLITQICLGRHNESETCSLASTPTPGWAVSPKHQFDDSFQPEKGSCRRWDGP